MSWTKAVTLWCDHDEGDDCQEWVRPGPATVKAAEKQAREIGWSATNGKHYCPDHSGGQR